MRLPDLPSFWPILVALIAFGALGVRRGWVRELASLGAICLSWLIVLAGGAAIVGAANRLALIAAFTVDGGFDAADPASLLRSLRAAPAIDPGAGEWFLTLLFGIGVVGAILIGNRVSGTIRAPSDAVLGGLVGGLNGFVVAYVVLDYLRIGVQSAGRSPAMAESAGLLGGYVTTVVVLVVLGAVGVAMLSSNRSAPLKSRRSGRGGG